MLMKRSNFSHEPRWKRHPVVPGFGTTDIVDSGTNLVMKNQIFAPKKNGLG